MQRTLVRRNITPLKRFQIFDLCNSKNWKTIFLLLNQEQLISNLHATACKECSNLITIEFKFNYHQENAKYYKKFQGHFWFHIVQNLLIFDGPQLSTSLIVKSSLWKHVQPLGLSLIHI